MTPAHEKLDATLAENERVPLVPILQQFAAVDALLYHDIALALLAAQNATLDYMSKRIEKNLGPTTEELLKAGKAVRA